ncbi:MAG: hypothetical protein AAGI23_21480 [Bacteroidota bacterium]
MNKFTFDANGNLTPYRLIECSLGEFISFIKSFDENNVRHGLYESYTAFLDIFQQEITTNFYQIIDGGFVSKKRNPRDIDVVTFIDYDIYELNEAKIRTLKDLYRKRNVDNYFEKVYPISHSYHIRYRTDFLYWNDLFTRNRRKQKKGYLKITFGDGVNE